MAEGETMKKLERVTLIGDHPWAGFTGEVMFKDNEKCQVRLDHGYVVMAFHGQWKPV